MVISSDSNQDQASWRESILLSYSNVDVNHFTNKMGPFLVEKYKIDSPEKLTHSPIPGWTGRRAWQADSPGMGRDWRGLLKVAR